MREKRLAHARTAQPPNHTLLLAVSCPHFFVHNLEPPSRLSDHTPDPVLIFPRFVVHSSQPPSHLSDRTLGHVLVQFMIV